MRILRIINSLDIGGAERSIAGNVPLHIKHGYKMDVLLLNGKKTFFLDELRQQGVKVRSLGQNNSVYNPLLIFKLLRYINKYDLIHVHLFPALYWVAFAKMLSLAKAKLVFTEHNTENRRRNNWFFKIVDRIAYRQYETIIAITNATNETLTKHLGYQANIVTICNGVNLSKIREEGEIELTEFASKHRGRKILLQIASFTDRKDQDTLIRTLPLLPDNYVAVFIGDGERRAACEELSSKLKVQDRVDFLGLQDNVGAYINLSEAVIMSSHVEGFGRSAVEGMALKKPVVASNVPGLADVVRGAGLLFEAGDYNKLSEIVSSLSNDRDLYEEVAQKCFERAEIYAISNMVKQYEEIYDDMSS